MFNNKKQNIVMDSKSLNEFASLIITSYEFAAEWPQVFEVAEIIEDETDNRISRVEASAVLNYAMAKWDEIQLGVCNELETA